MKGYSALATVVTPGSFVGCLALCLGVLGVGVQGLGVYSHRGCRGLGFRILVEGTKEWERRGKLLGVLT